MSNQCTTNFTKSFQGANRHKSFVSVCNVRFNLHSPLAAGTSKNKHQQHCNGISYKDKSRPKVSSASVINGAKSLETGEEINSRHYNQFHFLNVSFLLELTSKHTSNTTRHDPESKGTQQTSRNKNAVVL